MRRHPPLAGVALVLLVLFLGALAGEASARNVGIFYRSGRYGTDCRFCHVDAGTSFASLNVSPVVSGYPDIGAGYVPSADYLVTVAVGGGPGLEFGFNFSADKGSGAVLDGTRTQQYLAEVEFTHTLAGTSSPVFQFLWTAPDAAAGMVTMWLAVNSTNNSDTRFGDAVGTTTLSAAPVPPEIFCRVGSTTGPNGLPATPLRVNGSAGDGRRFVRTDVLSRLSVAIDGSYTGAPDPIRYALYAIRHENRANEVTPLPGGAGHFTFPIPPVGGSPDVLLEAFGDPLTFGVPRFAPAPLGPGEVLSVPRVPRSLRGRRVTFQILLESVATASGLVAGNAVIVEFAP